MPLLVVKRGGEPIELVVGRDQRELVPVDEVAGVADTTGAGDAFAGGFLAATIAGADKTAAVAAGHEAASAVLRDHAAE